MVTVMVMVDIEATTMWWWRWLVVVMGKMEIEIFLQNDCDRIMQAMMLQNLSKIGIGLITNATEKYFIKMLN